MRSAVTPDAARSPTRMLLLRTRATMDTCSPRSSAIFCSVTFRREGITFRLSLKGQPVSARSFVYRMDSHPDQTNDQVRRG
jgi:hypothetical protein